MPRRSYLDPQFRNLHTEQIGPSSHKNEYRSGVLVGNWAEDQIPRQQNIIAGTDAGRLPSSKSSTYASEFGDKHKLAPPQPMTKTPDLGRELLFGHAAPLAKEANAGSPQNTKEIARFQAKRTEWRDAKDPDSSYSLSMTTKAAELDRNGDRLRRDPSLLHSLRAAPQGISFSSTFVNDHQVTGLRTPYIMTQTPLVRLGSN